MVRRRRGKEGLSFAPFFGIIKKLGRCPRPHPPDAAGGFVWPELDSSKTNWISSCWFSISCPAPPPRSRSISCWTWLCATRGWTTSPSPRWWATWWRPAIWSSCDENLGKLNGALKRAAQVQTGVEPHPDGTCTVRLFFADDGGPLMELKFLYPSQEKGRALAERFQETPEAFYHDLMTFLSEERKKEQLCL